MTDRQMKATVYGPETPAKTKAKPGQSPSRGAVPGEVPGLPGIGSVKPGIQQSAPGQPASSAASAREFIGIRTPGGVVRKLYEKGTSDHHEQTWYMRPIYMDQKTADISLLIGTDPYVEHNKLWQRYVVRGIPPGPNNVIQVTIKANMDPNVDFPRAALITGASKKTPLTVTKPREGAPSKDENKEEPRELRPVKKWSLPVTSGARA
jgi:hypothetical protein